MKDTSVIPKGLYCYDETGICPYWGLVDGAPNQYNGYCYFLEKGDLDLAEDMTFVNPDTGETMKGNELPFPTSLLWDQCKECGINTEDEELIITGT